MHGTLGQISGMLSRRRGSPRSVTEATDFPTVEEGADILKSHGGGVCNAANAEVEDAKNRAPSKYITFNGKMVIDPCFHSLNCSGKILNKSTTKHVVSLTI